MGDILVTGAAGFIGFHLTRALIARGERVIGLDNLNDYYDPALKHARLSLLRTLEGFSFVEADIADDGFDQVPEGIDRVVHLAAQAGVRYSIENPHAYVRSNLIGHANFLEFVRHRQIAKSVYASSSSIYGGNRKTPFAETDMTDDPVSFYGATKKSNELMSRSYARLYGLDLTGLRFFTVYGPWGRPDMAYWIFTKKVRENETIRIFNHGKMGRDFTYVDDCVAGIMGALDRKNAPDEAGIRHRVYNLGNDSPEELMELVSLVEKHTGIEADKSFEGMQQGDVERTWADIGRAREELGYDPATPLSQGIKIFVEWYRDWAG